MKLDKFNLKKFVIVFMDNRPCDYVFAQNIDSALETARLKWADEEMAEIYQEEE